MTQNCDSIIVRSVLRRSIAANKAEALPRSMAADKKPEAPRRPAPARKRA